MPRRLRQSRHHNRRGRESRRQASAVWTIVSAQAVGNSQAVGNIPRASSPRFPKHTADRVLPSFHEKYEAPPHVKLTLQSAAPIGRSIPTGVCAAARKGAISSETTNRRQESPLVLRSARCCVRNRRPVAQQLRQRSARCADLPRSLRFRLGSSVWY